MAKYIFAILPYIFFVFLISPAYAANPGDVVINEIAWMGTTNSHNDEWIELYNNTDTPISLEGWILQSTTDDSPGVILEGSIPAESFFLLERTDDTSVPDQQANQIYIGSLKNSGERLELIDDQGSIIDTVNSFGGWFAGDNIEPTERKTMERINPILEGSDALNWNASIPVDGTPKEQNSVYQSDETSPTDPTPPSPPSPPSSPSAPEPQPDLVEISELEAETEPIATSTLESTTNSTTSSALSSLPKGSLPISPEQIVYPSSIFINELMPSPLGSDAQEEWIEIINESNEQADISSWQIRDTLGAIHTYTFPEDTSIAAHAFLVLSRVTSGITMNNDDDAIELLTPIGTIIQNIPYSKTPKGQSYARTEAAWEWSTVPTPGSANITPALTKEPASPKTSRDESQSQREIKKTPVYKTQSTTPKNTSINTKENPRDSKKETPTTTTIQTPETNTSPTQTAVIGDLTPGTQNNFIYILAPLIALLSAIFIFLLKKRLAR